MAVFAVSFTFAMIASQVWDTKLTWWAFILCVVMGVVMILPIGKSASLSAFSLKFRH
jgi:hypothetical protein